MPKYGKHITRELQEDFNQVWKKGKDYLYDQYGFQIYRQKGFVLKWKGKDLVKVYSLPAAKLIAAAILNDYVRFKPKDDPHPNLEQHHHLKTEAL